MSIFKIQRIRSCVQCGDVLALKCAACTKHPERKPRVLEIYDWPPILKTAECGCCIQISCQAEGCTRRMWRNVKHNKASMAASKRSFCSIACAARSMAMARCTRQTVPCDWCKKPVTKKSYALKTWKKSFCNQTCYFLRRAKDAHAIKEAERNAPDAGNIGLLHCVKCNDVTEHLTPKNKPAMCKTCQTTRAIPSNVR